MVKESLQYINDPIQLAGNVIDNGTTKFSVWGTENCSTINLTFIHRTCQVKCTEGMCTVNFRNKKNIHKCENHGNCDQWDICSHIETLFENIDLVKSFFPDFFDSTEESDEEDEQLNYNMHMIEDVDNEDGNVHTEINGNFNIETGGSGSTQQFCSINHMI